MLTAGATAISFVIGVVVFGGFMERDSAGARVDDYITGSRAEEFFASDAQFRAAFPTQPERSDEVMPVGDTDVPLIFYMSVVGDAGFSVAVFDLAPDVPFDFHLGANGAASNIDGHLDSVAMTNVQGFEAAEYAISAPDGAYVKALVVRTPSRVYQVQVVGRDNPPKGYVEFTRSFEISS